MNKKRPVNLDLTTIKLPVMAVTSILHRISGLFLFLLLPFILYGFSLSLHGSESFNTLQVQLTKPLTKIVLFGFLAALIFHLFAGIRHLLLDLGWGEGLEAARRSATILLIIFAIALVATGVWLW